MMPALVRLSPPLPPVDRREVLRYAGVPAMQSADLEALCARAEDMAAAVLRPEALYVQVPLLVDGDTVCLGDSTWHSESLARHLSGCTQAVLMAATLGLALDRLVQTQSVRTPSFALILNALGAERVEALCDCTEVRIREATGCASTRRFSPGYGDLSIDCQQDMFRMLQCGKYLNLRLTQARMMIPSKSVTAILGLKEGCSAPETEHRCDACEKQDCMYRRG